MTRGQKTWVTKDYDDKIIQHVTWFVQASMRGGVKFFDVIQKVFALSNKEQEEFTHLLGSDRFNRSTYSLYLAFLAYPDRDSVEYLCFALNVSYRFVVKKDEDSGIVLRSLKDTEGIKRVLRVYAGHLQ
jgi:hypothetical protein